MQEQKKLSIIVPVYNAEQYMEKCLNRLLEQSYSNIEIIIVNDCSQGNCEEIADKYDSDLVIIPSSKHELLFIKRSSLNIPICNIKQMVYTINRTEVDSKDVLSDSVYIYDRKKKKIIVY